VDKIEIVLILLNLFIALSEKVLGDEHDIVLEEVEHRVVCSVQDNDRGARLLNESG